MPKRTDNIGKKDSIQMMVQLKTLQHPMTIQTSIPKRLRAKWDKYAKRFLPKVLVKVEDINTMEKLVWTIYNNYGYGRFNALFISDFVKNKKYAPCEQCVRRYHIRKPPRIRKKHNKLYCRKTYRNWVKMFECEIRPRIPDETGKDYSYKIYFNKMSQFWFFRK